MHLVGWLILPCLFIAHRLAHLTSSLHISPPLAAVPHPLHTSRYLAPLPPLHISYRLAYLTLSLHISHQLALGAFTRLRSQHLTGRL